MKFWTWQHDKTKPTVGDIDPRCLDSDYNSNPEFRPAFDRLWEELGTDQLIWCFVDEKEATRSPWRNRSRWILEVPQESIFQVIDPGVWERILGSGAVPPQYDDVRAVWASEAIRKDFPIGEYVAQEHNEYLKIPPPGGDWWPHLFLANIGDDGWTSKWLSRTLCRDATASQVLLKRPIPESCAKLIQ